MAKSDIDTPKIQMEVDIKSDKARQEIRDLDREAKNLQKTFNEDRKAAKKNEKDREREYNKQIKQNARLRAKIEDNRKAHEAANRTLAKTTGLLNGHEQDLARLEKEKAELLRQGKAESRQAKQVNADIEHRLTTIDALRKQQLRQQKSEAKILDTYKQQTLQLEQQKDKAAELLKQRQAATKHHESFGLDGERYKAVMAKREEARSAFGGMDIQKMNIGELGRMKYHVENSMAGLDPDDPALIKYQQQLEEVIQRTRELKKGKDALAKAEENSRARMRATIEKREQQLALMDTSTKAYKKERREIRKLKDELERTEKGWTKSQQRMRKGMDFLAAPLSKLGIAGTLIGASLAIAAKAFTAVIRKAMEFEQAMADVKAATKAGRMDMFRLRVDALRLGAATKFTASEVAGLQKEFGKLGFTTKEILAATAATLDLATATGTDLARAAEVSGSTLRGFGMEASEMKRVTDVMADSFSSSALDMSTFAESMKYVAPVAAAAGISIEETTAMLSSMADAGIKGSQAGTSLRRIITDLGAGSEPLSKKLGQLNEKGLTLSESMDEVGRTAQTALLVLSENTEKVDKLSQAYENSNGAAKRMAAIQGDTLSGALTRMKSAWEGFLLGIEDGTSYLAKATRGVVEFSTSLLGLATNQKTSVDALKEERLAVNGMAIEMRNANTTAERRQEIYNELLKINPELVAGIDMEKISYKQLNQNLERYNELSLDRIANEQIKLEIDRQQQQVFEKKTQQANIQRKLNRELFESAELLGGQATKKIIRSADLSDMQKASAMLKQLNAEITKAQQNAWVDRQGNIHGIDEKHLERLTDLRKGIQDATLDYKEAEKKIGESNLAIKKLHREQQMYEINEDKLQLDLKAQNLVQLLGLQKKYNADKYAFSKQELDNEIKAKRAAFEAVRKITLKQLSLQKMQKLEKDFDPSKGYSFTRDELQKEIKERKQHAVDVNAANEELREKTRSLYREMLGDKEKQLEAQRQLDIQEIKNTKAATEYKVAAIDAINKKYDQLLVRERKAVLSDLMKQLEVKAAELDSFRQSLSRKDRKAAEKSEIDGINTEYDGMKGRAEKAQATAFLAGDQETADSYDGVLDRIEEQRKIALDQKKLEHEQSYQEQLKAIREEAEAYWFEHDEEKAMALLEKQKEEEMAALEKQERDLGTFEEFEALKAAITEKYAKKRDETEAKFDRKKLQRYRKYAQDSMSVIGSVSDFFSAAKQSELDAAGDNEEKKKAILKKYADINMVVQIAQTTASTAVAIMRALSDLGPIAGGIASVFIGATGAVQIAQAVQERNRIKGLAEGGNIEVVREQDGKSFNARKTDKRGFLDKPSVLVAEEGTEYVIPNAALQNPEIAAFVNEIEQARVAKTLPQLNFEKVNTAITESRAFAAGVFTEPSKTEAPVYQQQDSTEENDQSSDRMVELIQQLITVTKQRQKVDFVWSEFDRYKNDIEEIEEQTSVSFE